MFEISDQQKSILQEFSRRKSHAINAYVPTNKKDHDQLSYHKAQNRYRLLFGGNQSGKSHAAAYDCACNARGKNPFGHPNITGRDVVIWVISTEYATIRNGIYNHLRNIIPDWELLTSGAKIPGTNLPSYFEVKRPDGFKTTIWFMSAKGDSREKFQAAAVDYFYIDEEIESYIWEELEARTLATAGTFSISATLVESYEWITKLESMALAGNPKVFMTRLRTDLNDYLDQDTVEYLKSKWSYETKEYRIYGKSRLIQGVVYNTWDDRKHIVDDFKIPEDWPRWNSIDPGIRVCAALWIACDPEGNCFGYREMYAQNEPLWQIAIEIKKAERFKLDKELTLKFNHYVWEETDESEHMVIRLIDPKGRARSEAGEESILSQLYSRYGLACTPADSSMRTGLEDCRFWIEGEPPRFRIFRSLFNFQEERRVYKFRPASSKINQSEPIDDPVRKKNHLMDCWRYIAREHPKWDDRFKYERYEDEKPYVSPHDLISQRVNVESVNEFVGSEW